MKYIAGSFPTCPVIAVPVIFVTLLILISGHAKGQSLAMNQSSYHAQKEKASMGKLDESKLINGNYTTFFGYTLEEDARSAEILFEDPRSSCIKSFPVEATPDGYITIPARLLLEGIYSLMLVVNGDVRD